MTVNNNSSAIFARDVINLINKKDKPNLTWCNFDDLKIKSTKLLLIAFFLKQAISSNLAKKFII
jgi:hypothetical protein